MFLVVDKCAYNVNHIKQIYVEKDVNSKNWQIVFDLRDFFVEKGLPDTIKTEEEAVFMLDKLLEKLDENKTIYVDELVKQVVKNYD